MTIQLVFLTSVRLVLSGVFLASSAMKLSNPRSFSSTIASYKLIPIAWTQSIALALIGTEITTAYLLLIGWRSQATAALYASLMVIFIGALGLSLVRGRAGLECGCFGGKHRRKISLRPIIRNFLLLLMASIVMLWGGGLLSLDAQSNGVQEWFLLEMLLPLLLISAGLLVLVRLSKQLFHQLSSMNLEEQ